MAVIGADLDHLRATIAALRQGHATVQQAFQSASQAMQTLQSGQWSGQHRLQAEAIWERVQAQLPVVLNDLEGLVTRTERFADNLETAGSQFNNSAVISGASAEISHAASNTVVSGEPNQSVVLENSPSSIKGVSGGQPSLSYERFKEEPTTNSFVLNNTAGCTNYVLRRLNLDDMGRWPDAHGWNEAARDAGYVVSDTPPAGTKGAVMVFEAGVSSAHSTAGHVAYVEDVVYHSDGTMTVKISEANVVYGENGSVIWGTHTDPTTRELKLQIGDDGKVISINGKPIPIGGVSFILGRPADRPVG